MVEITASLFKALYHKTCTYLAACPVGEPNEALTGEDCMEMVTSWGYQWNDKRCDHEQQYICKKPGICNTQLHSLRIM